MAHQEVTGVTEGGDGAGWGAPRAGTEWSMNGEGGVRQEALRDGAGGRGRGIT